MRFLLNMPVALISTAVYSCIQPPVFLVVENAV
jgi:hypothetical protein